MSVGAALLAVVAVVLAARPRGEVRAGRFALVNGRGEEVGSLGVDEHEQPRLALKLAATKGTVVVGSLAGDVGGLGVVGEKGAISLAVDGEGFPGLSVCSDRRSAVLVISREGEPTLLMVGADRENLSATPSSLRLRRTRGTCSRSQVRPGRRMLPRSSGARR